MRAAPWPRATDLRPHLAVYALALLFANVNVFEIPLAQSWVVWTSIVVGGFVAQGRVGRSREKSPPYGGVFAYALAFHVFVATGVFVAIALMMRARGNPAFHGNSEILAVPFVVAAMALAMTALFGLSMRHTIDVAARETVEVDLDAPHRSAALRAPWRAALAGAAGVTIFALPASGSGPWGLLQNPGSWLAALALVAQLALARSDAALRARAAQAQADRALRDAPAIPAGDPYREPPPPESSVGAAAWARCEQYCTDALRRARIPGAIGLAMCLVHAWRAM